MDVRSPRWPVLILGLVLVLCFSQSRGPQFRMRGPNVEFIPPERIEIYETSHHHTMHLLQLLEHFFRLFQSSDFRLERSSLSPGCYLSSHKAADEHLVAPYLR